MPRQGRRISALIDRFFQRDRNWIICAVAVLALQAVLVLTHRPWLDEWQALQISLQSPTLPDLFDNLRYEGHPPLWYLMVRSVGQILPPDWVLRALALPIAIALQALVLFRLPFERPERLLLALNPFFLLDYGAISRSLGLGVFLFMFALLFRHRKLGWLAIAALPMIDFLFGILSIVALFIYWRERRIWLPGIALWLVSGLAAAWSVRPAPDMIPAFGLSGAFHDSIIEVGRFGAVLLPLGFAEGRFVWNELPGIGPAVLGGLIFFAMGGWLLRKERIAQALFAGFVGLIFVFSVAVYPLAIRHASLAAVLLITLLAIGSAELRKDRALFAAWLAVGACCGIATAWANLIRPFDTARTAAEFIIDHKLEAKHWVAYRDSRAQGISALTGIEFERLERDCTQSFIRWNYRSKIRRTPQLERELLRIARRSGSYYLVTDLDLLKLQIADRKAFRQLAFIPAGFDGQDFYIYRVHPELPETSAKTPQCPPGRLPLRILPETR